MPWQEPTPGPRMPLLARIPFATALRFCGLFLGMWIVGNWFADLQKSLRGLHTACEVVAGCGCLLFVGSSYVAIRAWQLAASPVARSRSTPWPVRRGSASDPVMVCHLYS